MQALLIRDHIQALGKVVCLFAVERRRKVARGVKRRAVRLDYKARRHAVLLQIHYVCAVGFLEQLLFAQFLDHRAHLVHIERFARIGVELNAQHIVYAICVLERQILEPLPYGYGLFVTGFNLLEPCAALVIQRRILFGLGVELYVQIAQRLHAALLNHFAAAPVLICRYHLAELSTPIAQMVYAHALIAQERINLIQCIAQRRGGQMADVETLCYIYRGIVYADSLARAHVAGAVFFTLIQHFADHAGRVQRLVDEEIQIAAHGLYAAEEIGVNHLYQFARDHRRRSERASLKHGKA